MRLYLYGKSQESLSILITDTSLSKQALPTISTTVIRQSPVPPPPSLGLLGPCHCELPNLPYCDQILPLLASRVSGTRSLVNRRLRGKSLWTSHKRISTWFSVFTMPTTTRTPLS